MGDRSIGPKEVRLPGRTSGEFVSLISCFCLEKLVKWEVWGNFLLLLFQFFELGKYWGVGGIGSEKKFLPIL